MDYFNVFFIYYFRYSVIEHILEVSEVCWMLWGHVLVGIRLHVYYLFLVQCE